MIYSFSSDFNQQYHEYDANNSWEVDVVDLEIEVTTCMKH